MIVPDCVTLLTANFAMPKSRIFTVPSSSTRTLLGLMSRCTMPCSWRVAKALAELNRDVELVDQRERPLRARHEDGLEILAAQELHHDVGRAVGLAQLVNGDHVSVLQTRNGLGFALEPLARGLIQREIDEHHLERHVPLERRIPCLIEHAHAAATHHLEDVVAANLVGISAMSRSNSGPRGRCAALPAAAALR